MANPEHVAIVKAGRNSIREYRESKTHTKLDLSGADLSGQHLHDCKLYIAEFRNANLSGCCFDSADVTRAHFTGANLTNATFRHAEARDAHFCHADARKVNFHMANLHGAHFQQTLLSQAEIWQAKLCHATFEGAYLTDSIWGWCEIANTNFNNAVGLHRIDHRAPCFVGLNTLEENPHLPKSFLRGCGVADSQIEFLPSFFGNPFEHYSCFVSYSHADKPFAHKLKEQLDKVGIQSWIDERAMKPGDDIYAAVDKGIRMWDKMLLCCSEASLNSWWVEREIDTAIEKEMEFRKAKGEKILKIIPLNLDDSLFKWEGSHAAELRKRLAADFTDWKSDADKFEEQFERVVRALRTDDGPPAPIQKLGV